MAGGYKNKLGSWVLSVLEKTVFGFVSRIKENTIEFLEELPENSSKFLYGICLLMFVVVLGVAGLVILLASFIVIIVQNAGPDVDKILYAGQGFALLGGFFLVLSVVLILMVGKSLKSSTEKVTRKLVRKLEK